VSETQTVDAYIAKAAENELNYTRARVREMQEQIRRLKDTAERIARDCEGFLAGKPVDEEPF
jgi:molecular chaperone GrpE (heat shock protein)